MKKILFLSLLLPLFASAQTPLYQPFNRLMPRPLDAGYGRNNGTAWVPFTTTTAANDSLTPAYRFLGQTVPIGTPSSFTEYWYMGGTANGNLVIKFSGGGGGSTDTTSLSNRINLKANIASPTLTGVPLTPTAAPGTNTTQIASTAFVFAGLALKQDAFGSQTGNKVYASPDATSGVPGFRALVGNDIPALPESKITNLVSDLAAKQATLVSAANIKTINGSNVLGSGDLTVVGVGGADVRKLGIWHPGTVGTYITATPNGTGYDVVVPGGYFMGGNGLGAVFLPTTPTFTGTIASGTSLIMDITADPAVFTGTAPTTAALGDGKIQFLGVMNGNIAGGAFGVEPVLHRDTTVVPIVTNDVTVCASGCTYTSWTAALTAINGHNTYYNRYRVFGGGWRREAGQGALGLNMLDYVNLYGNDSDTRIYSVGNSASPASVSTISLPATCEVHNIKFYGDTIKYNFHGDVTYYYNMSFINCEFHRGGTTGGTYNIGMGLFNDQQIHFINCLTDTAALHGVYVHGNATTNRDTTKAWLFDMTGCATTLYHTNELEYTSTQMNLLNNYLSHLELTSDTTVYAANPSDRRVNRGFKPPFTKMNHSGNNIISYVTDYATQRLLLNDAFYGELTYGLASKGTGGGGGGSGTVTTVSVATANGVSGTVATATTTPAISLTLGAITPTSVTASGNVTGGFANTQAGLYSGMFGGINTQTATSSYGLLGGYGLTQNTTGGTIIGVYNNPIAPAVLGGLDPGNVVAEIGAGTSSTSSTFLRVYNGRDMVIDDAAAANPVRNPKAILGLNSVTKYLLLPRMTATQASALSSPEDGALIYVTSTNGTFTSIGFWGRANGSWTQL